jgi:hypothetical protein
MNSLTTLFRYERLHWSLQIGRQHDVAASPDDTWKAPIEGDVSARLLKLAESLA